MSNFKKTVLILTLALAAAFAFAGVSCSQKSELAYIAIPDVTVDLIDPENIVAVDGTKNSVVKDASGRELTSDEWLINCKFSKSYIASLGVGTYNFTYTNDSETGNIRLTVTDDEKPYYVFDGEVGVIGYKGATELPFLVKWQDSYQADYTPVYSLVKGGETVAVNFSDGKYTTAELDSGNYLWKAFITAHGVDYEYILYFRVQTFLEYLSEHLSDSLLLVQNDSYAEYSDGVFKLDTSANTDFFTYNLDKKIVTKAYAGGYDTMVMTFTSDTLLPFAQVWLTRDIEWDATPVAAGEEECYAFYEDGRTIRIKRENNKWVYVATVPIALQKYRESCVQIYCSNACKFVCELEITFIKES